MFYAGQSSPICGCKDVCKDLKVACGDNNDTAKHGRWNLWHLAHNGSETVKEPKVRNHCTAS